MKIGIVTPANLPVPAVYGGAIETLIENYLIENDVSPIHDLVVFSEFDKKAKELSGSFSNTKFIWLNDGLIYNLLDIIFRIFKKLRIIKTNYRFYYIGYCIKKYKLDVIVVEGNHFYVKYLRNLLGEKFKIILHIHSRLIESESCNLKSALDLSDVVVVVSEFIKADFLSRFNLNSYKVVVLNNCASKIFFNCKIHEQVKESLKRDLKIKPEDFVLIFTGRLVPDKGLLELVKACKTLRSNINIKLLIIGSYGSDFGKETSTRNDFEGIINKEISGWGNHFIHCKYIKNSLMPIYYSIADIAVVPSLCFDAAPLVPIEAMAIGLPIIFSNRGGMKEYITPKCGIMIDMEASDTVEEIINAIKMLYENENLRRKMAMESMNRSIHFNPVVYFESFNNILNL